MLSSDLTVLDANSATPPPPLIGALLRMPFETVRERMLAGLHERGFSDLIAAHLDVVMNGVVRNGQPTAMVPWKNTLSPADIAAVVTYERNTWSNHVGDAVQPAQVVAAKK